MSASKILWKTFVERGDHADFKIIVNDGKNPIKEFKVHKTILKQNSPVFHAMFESGMKEATDSEVIIEDISPEYMKHALRHIYGCKINKELKLDEIINILTVADKYQIKSMTDEYTEFVLDNYLNIGTCAILLANIHLFSYKLKHSCFGILQKYIMTVLNSETSLQISEDTLAEILDLKLNVASELDIINFVERWAGANIDKTGIDDNTFQRDIRIRQIIEKKLLSKLRFLTMTKNEFMEKFCRTGWLSSNERESILKSIESEDATVPSLSKSTRKRNFELISGYTHNYIPATMVSIDFQSKRFFGRRGIISAVNACNFSFHTEQVGWRLLGFKLYTIDFIHAICYMQIHIKDDKSVLLDSIYINSCTTPDRTICWLKYPFLLEKEHKYFITMSVSRPAGPVFCQQFEVSSVLKNGFKISENGIVSPVTTLIVQK